jgi:hypothetical protein
MATQAEYAELLQAAGSRRLLAITDVVDRAHMLWLAPDGSGTEATAAQCRLVRALLAEGLAQLGTVSETVPWYGGEAHGLRVLPTEQGRILLRLWQDTELASQSGRRLAGAA